MKFRALTSFFLFSVLVISVLSMAAQATEYREANVEIRAEELLSHIENGDDINLTCCRIVGEVDVSKSKLGSVPNPPFYESLNTGSTKEGLISYGLNENLSVIESNITIKYSVFENNFRFSNVQFKNFVDFTGTSFADLADFHATYFDNPADFSAVKFYDFANFEDMIFNSSVDFSWATFYDFASFRNTNFNGFTTFFWLDFYGPADFYGTNFNSVYFARTSFFDSARFVFTNFRDNAEFSKMKFFNFADFSQANFYAYTDFSETKFLDSADFLGTNFNDTAYFAGPDTSENVTVDGKTCEFFRKNYKLEARYEDADNIYYNYRKYSQERKSLTSLSKWIDIASWLTCGYGIRPSHTLYLGGTLMVLFSIIYTNGPAISLSNTRIKRIPFRFYFKGPGIVRRTENSENQQQKVSFWDALNFSITTFTTVGYGNWYPEENFKIWATLEGLLGWIMLGVFMATLTNVIIRV